MVAHRMMEIADLLLTWRQRGSSEHKLLPLVAWHLNLVSAFRSAVFYDFTA